MFRIHVAAKNAGVTTQLLRAWERRYGLVKPSRSPSGYRVYSEQDVLLLRGAKALVDEGRSISEVARLPKERIERAGLSRPSNVPAQPMTGSFQERALAAIEHFDSAALDTLLFHAMGMGSLSAPEICQRVLLPLLSAIGDRWEAGTLSVAAEHFGSGEIRRRMFDLLANELRHTPAVAPVICAGLENDLHEGGLLAFAIHAAFQRHAVVYLGTNTPFAEVLSTADARAARAIALTISPFEKTAKLKTIFKALADWKNQSPGREVYLGGRGATAHQDLIAKHGLLYVPDARLPPVA